MAEVVWKECVPMEDVVGFNIVLAVNNQIIILEIRIIVVLIMGELCNGRDEDFWIV